MYLLKIHKLITNFLLTCFFNLPTCFALLFRQLRNKVEERRGMLWMRELMKKIQEQESSGEDYEYDEGK